MAFLAQYSVTVALFDHQVEAWLLGPLLIVLFLMILIKALLELPLFYVRQKATLDIEHEGKKQVDRWIHFVGSMSLFIILVGIAAVIFEIVRASPDAATDVYNTVQEFTDPRHSEGDPLTSEQRAIVERYWTYSGIQLRSLDQDERFVARQSAKHKRDQRWLHVQSVLQRFAHAHALSQKQFSQHLMALFEQLEKEVKKRAAESPSATPK
jgi:hypothetical protein